MKSGISLYDITRMSAVLFLSFGAGMINGTVGAGSGIVFMLIWRLLSRGNDTRGRYSFAMSCVLVVSLVSLILYPAEASSDLPTFTLIAAVICGVLGGVLGALIGEKVRISWLNRAFALLTLYSGFSMVVGK